MFYGNGINYYNIDGKYNSIHAEVNAINKLPINNKRKKVNVFVFRTNKSGKVLTMAKPCDNCIKYIKQNLRIKGYRLNNIFYTDFNGYIMKLE
tara:strand:+ start:514 stop:792 length:279 start_codon:yes stop_codon:yes gene_type:complete